MHECVFTITEDSPLFDIWIRCVSSPWRNSKKWSTRKSSRSTKERNPLNLGRKSKTSEFLNLASCLSSVCSRYLFALNGASLSTPLVGRRSRQLCTHVKNVTMCAGLDLTHFLSSKQHPLREGKAKKTRTFPLKQKHFFAASKFFVSI